MTSLNTEKIGNVAEGVELLDPEQAQFYQEMGYTGLVKINGEIIAVYQYIFTWGIVCGLDDVGYKYRYCYESFGEAAQALALWITEGGERPHGYIKRK
jgi:hypothetical protein